MSIEECADLDGWLSKILMIGGLGTLFLLPIILCLTTGCGPK